MRRASLRGLDWRATRLTFPYPRNHATMVSWNDLPNACFLSSIFISEPVATNVNIADFDAVSYRLTTPDSKTVIVLSMKMPCWKDLDSYGARDVLAREYGEMLLPTAEQGFDVSLKIDIEKLPADAGETRLGNTRQRERKEGPRFLTVRSATRFFLLVYSRTRSHHQEPCPFETKRHGGTIRTRVRRPKGRRRLSHDGHPIPRIRSHLHQRNGRPCHRYFLYRVPRRGGPDIWQSVSARVCRRTKAAFHAKLAAGALFCARTSVGTPWTTWTQGFGKHWIRHLRWAGTDLDRQGEIRLTPFPLPAFQSSSPATSPRPQTPPIASPKSNCLETISTITSNVPRRTCTRACGAGLPRC